jgi:pimeloyl-ACP methyl ester carboxylesterase
MASSFRAGGGREPHHAAEAEKLLSDPRFFSGFNEITPELVFTSAHDFEFSSPIPSRWAQNNRVFGKLFRAGTDWERRPSVILLHGWNAELQYRWQFPFLASRLARAGINAAMFQLPYHGRRRPREPGAIQNFISYDLLHMLEATRQALADTRALLAWLAARGSPGVGLWGISLGAWLAGLLICSDSEFEKPLGQSGGVDDPLIPATKATNTSSALRPAFAVLLTPVANVDQAIEELAFCESIRCSLQSALASHRPDIPPKNILIVESQHDVFAPVETIERLWQAWGQPEIWRLPHGHISVLLSPLVMNRIVKWIARFHQ